MTSCGNTQNTHLGYAFPRVSTETRYNRFSPECNDLTRRHRLCVIFRVTSWGSSVGTTRLKTNDMARCTHNSSLTVLHESKGYVRWVEIEENTPFQDITKQEIGLRSKNVARRYSSTRIRPTSLGPRPRPRQGTGMGETYGVLLLNIFSTSSANRLPAEEGRNTRWCIGYRPWDCPVLWGGRCG